MYKNSNLIKKYLFKYGEDFEKRKTLYIVYFAIFNNSIE